MSFIYLELTNYIFCSDNMVLKLGDYISNMSEIKQEYDIMQNLIDKIENNLKFEKTKLTLNTSKKEFTEPLPSKTFEASRLILSQLKVFNFEVYSWKQLSYILIQYWFHSFFL